MAEVEAGSLEFRIKIDNTKIVADGKLMSRVFENLVQNILKYSLQNTRVYIESGEVNGKVYITFKNIANYEMNFKSDDIIERFVRSDSARADGGNGLGLAIAQSYTDACSGALSIEVDGELFKATIEFDKV